MSTLLSWVFSFSGLVLFGLSLAVGLYVYFKRQYAPLMHKTEKDFAARDNTTIPPSAIAMRNHGVLGLNSGFGPLHQAAERGDIQMLESFIKNRTFYYEGALEESSRRTSRLFKYFFPSLGRRSKYWVTGTPLHFACHRNQTQAVAWLLDHGAWPDALDDYGQTPLHYALANKNQRCIELLLGKGAKTNIKPDSDIDVFTGPWDEMTAQDLALSLGIQESLVSEQAAELLEACERILAEPIEHTRVDGRKLFQGNRLALLQSQVLNRQLQSARNREYPSDTESSYEGTHISSGATGLGVRALETEKEHDEKNEGGKEDTEVRRSSESNGSTSEKSELAYSDGYYDYQLKTKGKDSYSRYYEPNRSENEILFGKLTEYGYEFGLNSLGVDSYFTDLNGNRHDGLIGSSSPSPSTSASTSASPSPSPPSPSPSPSQPTSRSTFLPTLSSTSMLVSTYVARLPPSPSPSPPLSPPPSPSPSLKPSFLPPPPSLAIPPLATAVSAPILNPKKEQESEIERDASSPSTPSSHPDPLLSQGVGGSASGGSVEGESRVLIEDEDPLFASSPADGTKILQRNRRPRRIDRKFGDAGSPSRVSHSPIDSRGHLKGKESEGKGNGKGKEKEKQRVRLGTKLSTSELSGIQALRQLQPPLRSSSLSSPKQVQGIIDWNERFQNSIEQLKKLHINESDQVRTKLFGELVNLERDFLYCSETYGKIIISEYYLPYHQKTIKPDKEFGGFAGGDKYIVHNILFKLAIDSQKIFGPSDAAAAKIGGHELKGLMNYWNCNSQISLPLMALVDYRGFRIIAMSILPITEHTLVSGSSDAGRTVVNSCPEMTTLLTQAAKQLNLEEHVCGTRQNQTCTLNSATDLEGHIGLDGRLYVIDFSRTFPPEAPNSKFQRGYLYRLLRPEFVKKFSKPLCPDAFSNFIAHDPAINTHNLNVYNASLHLFQQTIPIFSSRFVHKGNEAVKSGQVKKFSVTHELHRAGINCRMLGLVRSVIPPTNHNSRQLLLIEMISRVVKNDLRFRLRETSKIFKIPLEEPYRKVVTEHLNLVFGNGPESVKYWNTTLKQRLNHTFPKAQDRYEYVTEDLKQRVTEFKVSLVKNKEHASKQECDGRFLILSRVRQMLGIAFRGKLSTYIRWFNTHQALNESAVCFQAESLERIGQRVKHINIIDYAQGFIYKEQGQFMERTESEDAKKYFKKALEKFSRALESNPNDKEVLTNCADLLTRIHGYGAAQHNKLPAGPDEHWVKTVYSYFNRALQIDKNDPNTLFHYANFLRYWRNEFSLAEEYYIKALNINPNFVMCLREFGNLHNYRGFVELADKFYERAKKLLGLLQKEKELREKTKEQKLD